MKIIIICPHLSTGGCPQVALKRVETLMKYHDVYFIEYREIAWNYVVQRNKLIKLLDKKFISLGWSDNDDIRDKFIEIIENINPDIIHMEEIPEMFINGFKKEHADWLYRINRPYKIIETTHTSTFDVDNKKYYPDKFMFVSKYSQQQYSKLNIPSVVIEYPIEKLEKNQSQAKKLLNLDPKCFHILNVGLFTRGKNQGYLFELARKLKEYNINFHFVGNLADNFSDYWKPILENKPDNCFIYGERNDVELFYQACDLLIHPSTLELNPLSIKEATSYDLPVFLNYLPTYLDMYDDYKNIKYLSMTIDDDINLILNNFNFFNNDYETSLLIEYDNIQKIDDEYIEYNIKYIDGAKVEIKGNSKEKFDVFFYDNDTTELIYSTKIGVNNWCKTNNQCFKNYKIQIKLNEQILLNSDLDLSNKNVYIKIDSSSIGDTLAWFPYVDEFRKKHNCVVYCSTFWNQWFINEYPDILFVNQNDIIPNLYAKYNIGWYLPLDTNRNPNDYKKYPLQKTASDILGLEFKELKPKINIPKNERPIEEKYVCIAQYSTANAKHWHYPCKNSNKGWQILVDWLNDQGYKVMVISKQKTNLKNILDYTGNFPIEDRINQLAHSEFFIGVGSGLSWLAWATNKKVFMISGFSKPFCEFKNNNNNIHNFKVCNGCFNKHTFDKNDWNWCPEHKNTSRQFECSINISPKMVTDKIIKSGVIKKCADFDFDKYDKNIILDKQNINIEKIDDKIIISYSGDDTESLNIDFVDKKTNIIYHTIPDIILSRNYKIWYLIPTGFGSTAIISFYEKNKILDIEFNIF